MAGRVTTQLVIEGKNSTKKAFDEVARDLNTLDKTLARTGQAIAGYLSFSALTTGIRAVATTSDQFVLMNARLKLATGSQEEFNTATKELQRIAVDTGSPVEALVTLYGRISRPLKEAGRSQSEILKVTEAVAVSFRVSGASAQEAENGVIQFAQALGSGALRGDEFNSVAEQAPRLMQALADGIGVPTTALKEMAAQGQLTAQVVTDALIGQLPTLNAELAGFGNTIGKELTAIQDVVNRGIGQADTGPLIDSLKDLRATLADQSVQANLTTLASALTTLATVAVKAGSEFAGLGDDIGYLAARLAGNVSELDRANKEIAKLQAADDGFGMLDLYMSDAKIKKSLAEWKAYREKLLEIQTGITAEARAEAEKAASQVKAIEDERRATNLAAERAYVDQVKNIQAEYVKAAENTAKELVAAERQATSELGRVREERLAIEKRYSTVLATLGQGQGSSFGDAQDLKAAANRALRAGDVETAKANAQAAVQILQQLASAGENTYGFEGFIKEMRGIELAANDIEDTRADEKVKAIQKSMRDLKAEADKLKEMPVSVKSDDASLQAVRTQIEALVQQLSKTEIVLPVRLNTPQATDSDGWYTIQDPGPAPAKFATGGHVQGAGTGTSDSILARLSNGEYVLRAAAVKQYGTALLDRMNGLHMPAFADGGMVEAAMSAPATPSYPNLGRMVLEGGGQSIPMYVAPEQALNLQRLAAKFGGTKRR